MPLDPSWLFFLEDGSLVLDAFLLPSDLGSSAAMAWLLLRTSLLEPGCMIGERLDLEDMIGGDFVAMSFIHEGLILPAADIVPFRLCMGTRGVKAGDLVDLDAPPFFFFFFMSSPVLLFFEP